MQISLKQRSQLARSEDQENRNDVNFICESGPKAQKISKSNLYIELENKSLELKSQAFNSALNESKILSS